MAIGQSRAVDNDTKEQTQRIHRDVTFPSFNVLSFVVAVAPPFCGVLTDCESMIAAEGVASCPD